LANGLRYAFNLFFILSFFCHFFFYFLLLVISRILNISYTPIFFGFLHF
jgi:hypothetical protein